MQPPPLPLGAWAILALLCEHDTHGWTLVRALAPEGEIGRVWSIRRALVYRTVEQAIEAGLAARAGLEAGARGSPRTLLRATPAGRRAVSRWLAEPVAHVRDLRSELLLKLLFAQRAAIGTAPLLRAQRELLAQTVAAFATPADDDDSAFDATLRAFRRETATAGLRFVDAQLERAAEPPRQTP